MVRPALRTAVVFLLAAACGTAPVPPAVGWQPFSAEAFAAARAQQRLVLLDLGTGWCHWCHVMEATTFADPQVRELLARHYVAARADADERLDLAARYQDYGWPATIVFDADGRELVKRRGYIAPGPMAELLAHLAAAPLPSALPPAPAGDAASTAAASAPGGADAATLADGVRAALVARQEAFYDPQRGGWGDVHKYLDADAFEWLLLAARRGDVEAQARVQQTLAAEQKLVDPVWGGAYQYSHGGDWDHPHFEKIMSRQLADLRGYALAAGPTGDAALLAPARAVARYLRTFLRTPEGAFRASQDADLERGEHGGEYFALGDAGRRARGLPAIDPHCYGRENGQAIQGLCALGAGGGDADALADAVAAGDWLLQHRVRGDGLCEHDAAPVAGGPFLADSLEAGRAFLALWETTQQRRWLDAAQRTAAAIELRFAPPAAAPAAGYRSAVGDGVLPALADRSENVALARWCNQLFQVTGDADQQRTARRAFAFCARPEVALQPGMPADLLLADRELGSEPMHVVVLGRRDDPAAQALFATALAVADPYRRIEWLQPGEKAPRADVGLPAVAVATAFACADGACSAPMTTPAELARALLAR